MYSIIVFLFFLFFNVFVFIANNAINYVIEFFISVAAYYFAKTLDKYLENKKGAK